MLISTKDLNYLSDELSWELLAMKKCHHYAGECQDPQIQQLINQTGQMHQQHYETLLTQLQSAAGAGLNQPQTGANQTQQPQQTGTAQAAGTQPSPGLPNVKGPEMNDRDIINDVLATEKYLAHGYNTAVNEASTDELFQTQLKMLNEVHQAQRNLYNLMHQKGWYKLDNADAMQVSKKAQQFANYRTQFPYS